MSGILGDAGEERYVGVLCGGIAWTSGGAGLGGDVECGLPAKDGALWASAEYGVVEGTGVGAGEGRV